MESGCFEHPPLRTAGTRLRRGPLVVHLMADVFRNREPSAALERPRARVLPVCCLHTDGPLVSAGLSVGDSVQAGMCIARGRAKMRNAKGTRRSRRRGAADHRRLVVRPRATHIPACMLAPSPAVGGLRLGRKLLGRVPACIDRFRIYPPNFSEDLKDLKGFVLLKLFLYQNQTHRTTNEILFRILRIL